MTEPLTVADYPLAETRPERVAGRRGNVLSGVTLDATLTGEVTMEDLQITSAALMAQAEIARAAGRPTLALNFERAAELVDVPQDVVMAVYELLRPGRANSKQQLLDAAGMLAAAHNAPRMSRFIEEAAEVYERRGLFMRRY